MELQRIKRDFSVCKVTDYSKVNLESEYCFIGKTDEEKRQSVRTAGGHSGSEEYLTFP